MKHAVQSQQFPPPDLFYFLTAFAMAFVFAMTLAGLEPVEKKTGYLRPVTIQIAASGVDRADRKIHFDDGG